MSNSASVEAYQIIDQVKNLPVSAQVLPSLLRHLKDPNISLTTISELIRLDPSLTIQLMRIANSSFFSAGERCETIDQAIKRVGYSEAYNVTASVITLGLMAEELPAYGIKSRELWLISLSTASLMKELALCCSYDPDTSYTIGLLNQVGKVIINKYILQNKRLLESVSMPLEARHEHKYLGISNEEIGAALLQKWNFPDVICKTILMQTNDLNSHYADALKISNLIALSLVAGKVPLQNVIAGVMANLERLEIEEEQAFELVADAQSKIEWSVSVI